MGIKDLNSLIQRYAPEALGKVSISFFKGKRIAIDGHNWMFRNMYGARSITAQKTNFATDKINDNITREEWLQLCLVFTTRWLMHGVIPVFVFDGKNVPGKKETQNKRREETKKKKDEFYRMVDQMNNLDILDRTPEMIELVQKQFTKFIDFRYDEIDNLINILNTIGIPWLLSTGEAEKLCTMLAIEGKVSAVFSQDTDNLCMGCPILIKDYSTTIYEEGVNMPALIYTEISIVLEKTGLTKDQFVDLCILLGCDYNERPSGYGIVNSYNQIKKYGSIKSLIENGQVDEEILNYDMCKNNFAKVPSSSLIESGTLVLSEPNPIIIGDVLMNNNLSKLAKGLCNAMAESFYVLQQIEQENKCKSKRKIKVIS